MVYVAIGGSSYFLLVPVMSVRKMEQLSREDIVEQISMSRKRIRELQRMLTQSTEEDEKTAISHQQCLHESRVLADSGPRDNGELTYRCLKCGALF